VAPKVLSFRLENDGMSMSVFGTYFNQYCICSFDGMSSFAIFVNNTAIRCILPRTNSEIFKFSTVCDGLSSEPLNLYPSLKDKSSFFVESFTNSIDGSSSCANVAGSQLHAIRQVYLCDTAVDVPRDFNQVLNICVVGRHHSCHLQLFDSLGSVLYTAVVNSSSMGNLAIYPSLFISQSWITITVTAFNLKGSTCSLSCSKESFNSTSDTLIVSQYLDERQNILQVQCVDASSESQSVSFAITPRNFVYSVAPVFHSSGSSVLFTLFGKNFDTLPKACCRIGDEFSFVKFGTQHQGLCEFMIPGYMVGNVSLFVYHVCGEGHFFNVHNSSQQSFFCFSSSAFVEKFRGQFAL
jgi:hypothetical protein